MMDEGPLRKQEEEFVCAWPKQDSGCSLPAVMTPSPANNCNRYIEMTPQLLHSMGNHINHHCIHPRHRHPVASSSTTNRSNAPLLPMKLTHEDEKTSISLRRKSKLQHRAGSMAKTSTAPTEDPFQSPVAGVHYVHLTAMPSTVSIGMCSSSSSSAPATRQPYKMPITLALPPAAQLPDLTDDNDDGNTGNEECHQNEECNGKNRCVKRQLPLCQYLPMKRTALPVPLTASPSEQHQSRMDKF